MSGDAGPGQGRIGAGRLEAGTLAFEGQHPVAQHLGRGQGLAQALRHGAEVLSDHQAFRPDALQGQDAEDVIQREGDIGARRSVGALGHPELPGHAHDVVDPERPGVTHVDPIERRQRRIALGLEAVRIEGRQAPDLTVGSQRVGRGADGDSPGQEAGAGPGLGAVGRGPDRQIPAEPELQPGGAVGGFGELPLAQPLQILVEAHPPLVGGGEGPHPGVVRRAEVRRPEPPGLARTGFGDGLEGGEPSQGLAAGGKEGREGRVAVESVEGGLQRRALHRPDRRIVDGCEAGQGGGGGGKGSRARNPGEVQVDRVQEPAVGGEIGTGALPVAAEQGVQRIDPEHGGAVAGGGLAEGAQGGEVAHALVAASLHGIELG